MEGGFIVDFQLEDGLCYFLIRFCYFLQQGCALLRDRSVISVDQGADDLLHDALIDLVSALHYKIVHDQASHTIQVANAMMTLIFAFDHGLLVLHHHLLFRGVGTLGIIEVEFFCLFYLHTVFGCVA